MMCSGTSRNVWMLKQKELCNSIADAIALCRPGFVCAHADAPHARILERLEDNSRTGKLADCEFVTVSSDFAAISVATGAAAAGVRTYTATSSHGLLFMAEAVYNAAASHLPIVMTVGNSGSRAPFNAWNDHTDTMSMRDSGWIQLYAETNQEAVDLHVQAFRLAEALSCPVMVCVDGLVTHPEVADDINVPTQEQVDAYLPRFKPIGASTTSGPDFVGLGTDPETFTEIRYLAHHRQLRALSLIPRLAGDFLAQFGRPSVGLIRTHRTDDAETIIVALGSVNSIIRDVVDELRAAGLRVGSVAVCSFRPFPLGALRDVLQNAKRVVILERSLAVGIGGILSDGVGKCVSGVALNAYTVIAGLGGRAISRTSLRQVVEDAANDELEHVTFLDLNADFIASELERETRARNCASRTDASL